MSDDEPPLVFDGVCPSGASPERSRGVERGPGQELFEALQRGDYCCVFAASRELQAARRHLMARTAARLEEAGVAVAILDLTTIGRNGSPEQWYHALLHHLAEQIGPSTGSESAFVPELERYWREHQRFGPLQRWMLALRRVVLYGVSKPLVIFIDEIDAVGILPFSTDEFFAAIRECYNRRPQDEAYRRLTFCLLGKGTPSSLMRDTRVTPFNIGRRIELTDLQEAEKRSPAAGQGPPSGAPPGTQTGPKRGSGRQRRSKPDPPRGHPASWLPFDPLRGCGVRETGRWGAAISL